MSQWNLPYFDEALSLKPAPKPKPRHRPVGGYAYVEKHTSNRARLKRLEAERITDTEALALIEMLSDEFDLSPVKVKFNGRDKRDGLAGHFKIEQTEIVLHRRPAIGSVVHELAHHYVWNKLVGGREVPYHGADFTRLFDMLAEMAEKDGRWRV